MKAPKSSKQVVDCPQIFIDSLIPKKCQTIKKPKMSISPIFNEKKQRQIITLLNSKTPTELRVALGLELPKKINAKYYSLTMEQFRRLDIIQLRNLGFDSASANMLKKAFELRNSASNNPNRQEAIAQLFERPKAEMKK